MKKILLVGFLILGTLSAYSQTDTSRITLPTPTARKVIQDLVKLDGCVAEVQILQDKVSTLSQQISLKDTSITLLEQKDLNNTSIINKKDQQLALSGKLSADLQKQLRRQERVTLIYKIGSVLGGVTVFRLLTR